MMDPGRFVCARCGECCRWSGHVFLTEADVARLARALGLGERAFLDRYARLASNRAALVLAEREDGSCVFLDHCDCLVYDARPGQCRGYPLAWSLKEPCPGFPDESERRSEPGRSCGEGTPRA